MRDPNILQDFFLNHPWFENSDKLSISSYVSNTHNHGKDDPPSTKITLKQKIKENGSSAICLKEK